MAADTASPVSRPSFGVVDICRTRRSLPCRSITSRIRCCVCMTTVTSSVRCPNTSSAPSTTPSCRTCSDCRVGSEALGTKPLERHYSPSTLVAIPLRSHLFPHASMYSLMSAIVAVLCHSVRRRLRLYRMLVATMHVQRLWRGFATRRAIRRVISARSWSLALSPSYHRVSRPHLTPSHGFGAPQLASDVRAVSARLSAAHGATTVSSDPSPLPVSSHDASGVTAAEDASTRESEPAIASSSSGDGPPLTTPEKRCVTGHHCTFITV